MPPTLALYRKYRPRTFADVVGQDHVTRILLSEIKAAAPSHAYLFTGSRGTGKTSCAKILAKAVNCLSPKDGEPCCECENCIAAENASLIDIVEIDAASNNGVDNIREIRDEVVFTPAVGKVRVYIIDEVHMLSAGAFNALLKTLEEPPDYVIFILATTEIGKIPQTILSRCERFDFRRITKEDIERRILFIAEKEGILIEPEAASLIAKSADGALRDALALLDKCASQGEKIGIQEAKEAIGLSEDRYLYDLLSAAARGDFLSCVGLIADLYQDSKDLSRLAEELIFALRNLLILKNPGGEKILPLEKGELQELKKLAGDFTPEKLMYAIEALSSCYDKMARSANKKIDLELCFFRICSARGESDLAAILARLSELEARLAAGEFPSAPPEGQKSPAKPEIKRESQGIPPAEEKPAEKSPIKPGDREDPPVGAEDKTFDAERFFVRAKAKLAPHVMSFLSKCEIKKTDGRVAILAPDELSRDMLGAGAVREALSAVANYKVEVLLAPREENKDDPFLGVLDRIERFRTEQ